MTKTNRSRFTISANIIMTAALIARTLSFGFVMMSIYIRVGGDILNANVIKIADMEKIAGKLPLGTTVNCIVFSLIGVFVLELLTGIFALWGALGRKKNIIALSVAMSSLLIVVYVIYIVFLSIVYHEKSDFGESYNQYLTAYEADYRYSSGYYYIFPSFVSKLGCDNDGNGRRTCWHVYIEQLKSYLQTYFGLVTTCIFCQIATIIAAEYTYRKFELKEKKQRISEKKYYLLLSLQHGIFRNLIIFVRESWNQSRLIFTSVLFKIISLVVSFGLLGLGLTLIGDELITNTSLKHIFYRIMIYQYYFYDILVGMAAAAVVIGILSIANAILGLVGSRKKSPRMILISTVLSVFLHVARIITIIFWVVFIEKINDEFRSKMKIQQDGYYNNGLNTITKMWNDMLLQLHCCGVYSVHETNTNYGYWFCCSNADESRIANTLQFTYFDNVLRYFGECGGIKTQTCSGKILFKTRMYAGWFLAILFVQLLLEIIGIFPSNKEYHIRSSEKSEKTKNNEGIKQYIPIIIRTVLNGVRAYFVENYKRSKLLLAYFICVGVIFLFNFALLVLSINIRYDKIFGNTDIQDLLVNVDIVGVNLNRALNNFSIVVTVFAAASIVAVIYSTVILIPKTKKVILYYLNVAIWGILTIACITEIGIWGKYISNIYPTVTDELKVELNSYTYSHLSGNYELSRSLPWNTLFIKGECCGIGIGSTLVASSFTSSSWYTGQRDSSSQRVPIQCCKSETEIYPYNTRSNTLCTNNVNSDLFHDNGCDTVITGRLNQYSIPFFIFMSFIFIAEIICIFITIMEIKGSKTEPKRRVLVQVQEDTVEVTDVVETQPEKELTHQRVIKHKRTKREKSKLNIQREPTIEIKRTNLKENDNIKHSEKDEKLPGVKKEKSKSSNLSEVPVPTNSISADTEIQGNISTDNEIKDEMAKLNSKLSDEMKTDLDVETFTDEL